MISGESGSGAGIKREEHEAPQRHEAPDRQRGKAISILRKCEILYEFSESGSMFAENLRMKKNKYILVGPALGNSVGFCLKSYLLPFVIFLPSLPT